MCLDASVSAVSSLLGQTIIPIPVLGAVIGNTIGNVLYKCTKDYFNEKEAKIYKKFEIEQRDLENKLSVEYKNHLDMLSANMNNYLDLLNEAFSIDINQSFVGSITLAKHNGLPSEEILDSMEQIDAYFLE